MKMIGGTLAIRLILREGTHMEKETDPAPYYYRYYDIPEWEYDAHNATGNGVMMFGLLCYRCNAQDGREKHFHLFAWDSAVQSFTAMGVYFTWESAMCVAYALAVSNMALNSNSMSMELWAATCNSALMDGPYGDGPVTLAPPTIAMHTHDESVLQ